MGIALPKDRIEMMDIKRVMRPLLLLATGTALALFTLEGVSRWYLNYRAVRDPVLGTVVPEGYTVRSRIEGSGIAHFEDHGVRRAANLGPRRGAQILCLGDSFTEAVQVSDEDLYTTLTERELNRARVPAAVLDFGRSGWSIADYVANAQAYQKTFNPTWTVVQVHDEDFTADAWQTSKTHFQRSCSSCPIEVVQVPLVPDDFIRSIMRWLRNHSALMGILGPKIMFGALRVDERNTKKIENSADFPVLEELRMLADAYDGHLTLLLTGWFDPTHPGRDTDGEAAVKRAARELGISLACSKDEYPALAEKGIAPHGFSNTALNTGHLNAAGHAATARVLTQELLRLHAEGRL